MFLWQQGGFCSTVAVGTDHSLAAFFLNVWHSLGQQDHSKYTHTSTLNAVLKERIQAICNRQLGKVWGGGGGEWNGQWETTFLIYCSILKWGKVHHGNKHLDFLFLELCLNCTISLKMDLEHKWNLVPQKTMTYKHFGATVGPWFDQVRLNVADEWGTLPMLHISIKSASNLMPHTTVRETNGPFAHIKCQLPDKCTHLTQSWKQNVSFWICGSYACQSGSWFTHFKQGMLNYIGTFFSMWLWIFHEQFCPDITTG